MYKDCSCSGVGAAGAAEAALGAVLRHAAGLPRPRHPPAAAARRRRGHQAAAADGGDGDLLRGAALRLRQHPAQPPGGRRHPLQPPAADEGGAGRDEDLPPDPDPRGRRGSGHQPPTAGCLAARAPHPEAGGRPVSGLHQPAAASDGDLNSRQAASCGGLAVPGGEQLHCRGVPTTVQPPPPPPPPAPPASDRGHVRGGRVLRLQQLRPRGSPQSKRFLLLHPGLITSTSATEMTYCYMLPQNLGHYSVYRVNNS